MGKGRLQFWSLSILAVTLFSILVFGVATSQTVDGYSLAFHYSNWAIIPLISIATSILLLIAVVRNKNYIRSILWFCLFIISVTFWGVGDLMTFTAANSFTGLVARSFLFIPGAIGIPCLVVFVSDLTSKRPEKLTGARVLMFTNWFTYLLIGLGTSFVFARIPDLMVKRFWGYEIQLGPLSTPYVLGNQLLTIFLAVLVTRYYLTRKQDGEKKQARIFLISVLIPIIGVGLVNIVPALLDTPTVPIDSVFMTMMAGLMVYGITRYQLFTIDPARISDNILETMTESVVVTTLDYKLQYVNKNAMKLLGTGDPSESKEESFKSFLPEEDFEQIKKYLKHSRAKEESKKFGDLNIIAKHSKDKESTPVEISVSNVIFDKKKSAGLVFVISDISELQKAYSKLAEQEQKVEKQVQERTKELYAEHAKLEASISGLPIGFIMLDEAMKVVEQNEVARKLFSTRENNWWYVEDALEEMGVEKRVLRKLAQDEIIDIPEVVRGNNFLHIIISPIVSEGKILGRVILIEDITDQKAAERERNEFVVTASHEIRTPLSVIQGNLSNALDLEKKIDPVLKPLIGSAYKASNQISALFKDILIVSDIENEARPKPKFETTFAVKDAITEVIEHLEPSAKEKRLDLNLKISGRTTKVFGDRDEIKECILKLIDNGIKFTKKGSVEVSLSTKGGKAIIDIADSGQGISKTEEKRLFRKFIRLDNSLKREVGGAGLGLYIARALAERNGGELTLKESSAKGSVFSLVLPLAK